MGRIDRAIPAAAAGEYDLIVVGGGIYGVLLTYEAARRGLRTLLLERDDFGAHTSFNSLRIIHGGFRYLQSADLKRHQQSVAERRWFLSRFPDQVHPLPCLMPLYGKGLRRRAILGPALKVNDLLSSTRNRGLSPEQSLPDGRLVDPETVARMFPDVDTAGLQGGAIWYDAFAPDEQRLLMEILHRLCARGSQALNYVEAEGLLTRDGQACGVRARDRGDGGTYEFRAPLVVNAAGPWAQEVAGRFGTHDAPRFRAALAWNLLLDRPSPSDHALAVTPKKPGAQTYILVPWKGRVMAGTCYEVWPDPESPPRPTARMVDAFLEDLNRSIPGLQARHDDVKHVFAGRLPRKPGTSGEAVVLANRPLIVDHGKQGGPRGLISVIGVKYTTARRVASDLLERLGFPAPRAAERDAEGQPAADRDRILFDFDWNPPALPAATEEALRTLIVDEAVVHLDDLVVRRTNIGDHPQRALSLAPKLAQLFDWSAERAAEELDRLENHLLNVPEIGT